MPCADEVWRLQRGDDPECRAFRAMADEGHYRGKGGTRQGIYVVAPTGELLASVNALDPQRVLATLREGLLAWETSAAGTTGARGLGGAAKAGASPGSAAPPRISGAAGDEGAARPVAPTHRWEDSYPDDGLALVVRLRDLGDPPDPHAPPAVKWNQDHAWWSAEEVATCVPADAAVGDAWDLPAVLVERLARFHLVDAVVGQALPFAPEELVTAHLRAEVVSADDGLLALRLQGEFAADADGTWRLGENDWTPKRPWPRGVRWELLGDATWDRAAGTFTELSLTGLGAWWGRSQFNGRGRAAAAAPDGVPRGRLGVVLSVAPDVPAHRVAPAFVDLYDADWIVRPPDGAPRPTRAEETPGS